MSIKFVVFFQFSLRIIFNILVGYDWLEKSNYWTSAQESVFLQSFSTILEMLVASIWHLFAFNTSAFELGDKMGAKLAILDVLDFNDLNTEVLMVWMFLTAKNTPIPVELNDSTNDTPILIPELDDSYSN